MQRKIAWNPTMNCVTNKLSWILILVIAVLCKTEQMMLHDCFVIPVVSLKYTYSDEKRTHVYFICKQRIFPTFPSNICVSSYFGSFQPNLLAILDLLFGKYVPTEGEI